MNIKGGYPQKYIKPCRHHVYEVFYCEKVKGVKMPVKLMGKPFIRGIPCKINNEKLSVFNAFFICF